MKRRIKHNDLTAWFLQDHAQLPASYIKSCQEFFDEISKRQAPSRKHTQLNYQSIGDCYYDIYCQPQLTSKEDLLKDMVKILNGEITKQDYINEINQWNKEREKIND